jgi:hypothetical protein
VRFCVRRRRHVGIFEFTPGSLDFSHAISSAVTGSKQVWRLDTGVMSRGNVFARGDAAKPNWRGLKWNRIRINVSNCSLQ